MSSAAEAAPAAAAAAPKQQQSQGEDGPSLPPTVLRFVHINDCYELQNLPRFATAIREVRPSAQLDAQPDRKRAYSMHACIPVRPHTRLNHRSEPNLIPTTTQAREEGAAAVARGEVAAVKVVAVVAGDFLAPSLLSCLDKGRGMVDVLNACGVEVAIFGNHETDVPHKALLQRIHESRFVWVRACVCVSACVCVCW